MQSTRQTSNLCDCPEALTRQTIFGALLQSHADYLNWWQTSQAVSSAPIKECWTMRTRISLSLSLAASLLLALSAAADEQDFLVPLHLVHGHLSKVFFGCKPGATSGFDPRMDIMAPPPGIATGYTGFLLKPGNLLLYRDLRPAQTTTTWTFLAKIYKGKTVKISWDSQDLPQAYQFTIYHLKQKIDMRQQRELAIETSSELTITATKVPKP
jgi:hypothetical protein